jgi:hypothetical protein
VRHADSFSCQWNDGQSEIVQAGTAATDNDCVEFTGYVRALYFQTPAQPRAFHSIQLIPFYIFLELLDGDTLVVQPADMQAWLK